MKLLDFELDERIADAASRNTIFYDEGSRDISKRLIYFMFSYTEDALETVLVPTDAYPDFDWENPLYGIDIVRDRRLNENRTEGILKKHNITLSRSKSQLVLGLYGKSAVLGMV